MPGSESAHGSEPSGPTIRAAGGVVWRSRPDRSVEVAVIHRPHYDDWTFPKGKLEAGEDEIEGAVREVFEETGLRVEVGDLVGEAHYMKDSARGPRPKVVRYWAMKATGGDFEAGDEVDELRWLTPDEAEALLTYERDKTLLRSFTRSL